ncbi:unnamed protein product, partial [Symbiodinium necroappetens]
AAIGAILGVLDLGHRLCNRTPPLQCCWTALGGQLRLESRALSHRRLLLRILSRLGPLGRLVAKKLRPRLFGRARNAEKSRSLGHRPGTAKVSLPAVSTFRIFHAALRRCAFPRTLCT